MSDYDVEELVRDYNEVLRKLGNPLSVSVDALLELERSKPVEFGGDLSEETPFPL